MPEALSIRNRNLNLHRPALLLIPLAQLPSQRPLRAVVTVHDLDPLWPVGHAGDELDQAGLVGVGGVAADGFDASANGVAFAVKLHVAAFGAVGLNVAAGGAGGR